MTYFVDLSPYTFLQSPTRPAERLNVGWLDIEQPYKVGPIPNAFVNSITQRLERPENRTRGYHRCNLCLPPHQLVTMTVDGAVRVLGSAEIHVRQGKRLYICPDLIVHYVVGHSYCPPDEFVSAVIMNR